MKAWAITTTNIKRLVRDPSTIFFVFVFPMLLILVLGASFGGGFTPKVGVHVAGDGVYAQGFADQIDANEEFESIDYSDSGALLEDVERGIVQMGVIIPANYDDTLASGGTATVEYVGRLDQSSVQYRASIEAVATDQSAVFGAARIVEGEGLADFDSAVTAAQLVASGPGGSEVVVSTTGEALFGDIGQFDLGAPSNLILFVFLTSLAGSAALIQTRRLGVSRRMVSTPTSIGQILLGETGGRFAVAMIQGLFIMVGSAVAFDVKWGNLLGAGVLLVLIALIGAGAGMLMGALFDNDEQAGSMGVFIGLGLAALGGAMFPLEVFPDTMVKVAHITPHAWAIDGFAELIRHGGTLASIATEVLVLMGFAVVLLVLGTWRLRAKLTH
ncbi:MAG: ABC transporter permease [bacterium]|nr:ABC transporter permease [bacterium]MCP4964387.1 ABC transporter permease [bacterium]